MSDPLMLILSVINADRLPAGVPASLSLDGETAVLGRSPSCSWTLPDPDNHISGRHCEIAWRDGSYVLTDKSTNGTYLNGSPERMQAPHDIVDGDLIDIGHYQLKAALRPAGADDIADAPAVDRPLAGRYRLGERIAAGAWFDLFDATDTQLDRPVRVGIAHAGADEREKAVIAAHFAYWMIVARQPIPGLPAILAVEQAAEPGAAHGYMVSDWPDSPSLRSILAIEQAETLRPLLDRVLGEVLKTLSAIHARGLVHGDIGLDTLLPSTVAGTVWLTSPAPMPPGGDEAAYPAPELGKGQPATAAADIFALGKLIEDAATRAGLAAPAITRWMTLPKVYRPTAAELLDTLGLGAAMPAATEVEPVDLAALWPAPPPPPPPAPVVLEKPAPRAVSWEEFSARKQPGGGDDAGMGAKRG